MSDNDKVICPNCVHEFVAVPVNVQAKVAQLEEGYGRACKLVADVHAAASGRPGDGPRRGVIEDVADLRAALMELLARAEREICDPIDVPEIQQARHVLGLGAA